LYAAVLYRHSDAAANPSSDHADLLLLLRSKISLMPKKFVKQSCRTVINNELKCIQISHFAAGLITPAGSDSRASHGPYGMTGYVNWYQ